MNKPTPETYFARIVRKVFDDYFARIGASFVARDNDSVGISHAYQSDVQNTFILGDRDWHPLIRYDGPSWFVEVLYLPTDGPRYSPRVVIGPIPETQIDPRRNRIEVLHTIPHENDLRGYVFQWEYTSAKELEMSLEKVRDLIFEPFVKPFLNDPQRLIALVDMRAKQLDEETQTQIRNHNESIFRRLADKAWREHQYEALVNLYRQHIEHLTPAEIKRYQIALKHVDDRSNAG